MTLITSQIALVAKSVALDAIARAESAAENPGQLQHVQRALRRVAEGDVELGEGDFLDALEIYERVVRDVQGLACTAAGQSDASDSSRRFKANGSRSETGRSRRR